MSPTNVAAAGDCRFGSLVQSAYCSCVFAAISVEIVMILANCWRVSVRRYPTSSLARSINTGTPLGLMPDAGGRIVFELCIRMIMGQHYRGRVRAPATTAMRIAVASGAQGMLRSPAFDATPPQVQAPERARTGDAGRGDQQLPPGVVEPAARAAWS